MVKKCIKQFLKIWHNCLRLDSLFVQNSDTMSKTIDNVIWQQHHDAIKQRYELLFLQSKEPGITEEKYGVNDLIVSLTSYGQRIHNVYLTIESIMQQTLKPNNRPLIFKSVNGIAISTVQRSSPRFATVFNDGFHIPCEPPV